MDIGIVWRPCRVVELTCIKPTNRVAEYLSLGIPVVFQATAAYMDIVAESGYPLAANNVSHALQLVVSRWEKRTTGTRLRGAPRQLPAALGHKRVRASNTSTTYGDEFNSAPRNLHTFCLDSGLPCSHYQYARLRRYASLAICPARASTNRTSSYETPTYGRLCQSWACVLRSASTRTGLRR